MDTDIFKGKRMKLVKDCENFIDEKDKPIKLKKEKMTDKMQPLKQPQKK